MSKSTQIIAVKKPNKQTRNTLQTYVPADIDVAKELRTGASRERLHVLEQEIIRREMAIRRKEDNKRAFGKVLNRFVDAVLGAFALVGMVTALWFWRTVIVG